MKTHSKTHSKTWIEENPSWLKVLASPHPAINAALVVPLLAAIIFFGRDATSQLSAIEIIGAFTGGLLLWTFFEYAMHRWIYHGKYRDPKLRAFVESFHMYHHRNIDDPRFITAGPLMIVPLALTLLTPIWLLMGAYAAAISVGLLSGYYFYEWVHFLIHRGRMTNRYVTYITKYHMHHHDRRWDRCFGNTSSLWDHILGTYSESLKDKTKK